MVTGNVSPPPSNASSPSLKGTGTPLTLDLSSIPPLIGPSPPSNTLLITNLQDPSIFHPTHLLTIRDLINDSASLHSWAPLKSFRRIVVSFYTVEDAIRIRKLLDGEPVMGDRVRIYFGEATPIEPVDQHLHAPKSQKLFFISPPPSPPHGWEMRNEGPPNKEVHADDLASALAKLHSKSASVPDPSSSIPPVQERQGDGIDREGGRSRSPTVVYHPEDHGDSPHLPAVMVEDTTQGQDEDLDLDSAIELKIMAHTARPPVELMGDA